MDAGVAVQLALIIIMIVLTVIGNATMCVCIWTTRELHSPSGYIVASLAVADLLVGAWLLPFSIPAVINQEWTIGRTMCLVNGYTNHVLSVASLLGLFVISIDRYISIFYPLRYSEYMTVKRAAILIGCQWGYAFATATTPLVGWGQYTFTKGIWLCMTNFKVSYSFSYFIVFTVYGVPLTIMTFIYFRIFKIAFHHSRAIHQQACVGYGSNDDSLRNNSQPTTYKNATLNKWLTETSNVTVAPSPQLSTKSEITLNGRTLDLKAHHNEVARIKPNQTRKKRKLLQFKKEMRTGIVLSIIVVIFVLSWSPFAVLNLWALHSKQKTSLVSDAIVSRLAYFNSAINPPLYCLMNKVIRRSVKKIWFKIFSFLRLQRIFSCVKADETEFTVHEMTVK